MSKNDPSLDAIRRTVAAINDGTFGRAFDAAVAADLRRGEQRRQEWAANLRRRIAANGPQELGALWVASGRRGSLSEFQTKLQGLGFRIEKHQTTTGPRRYVAIR